MPETSRAAGAAPMFGEPDPEAELELRATEGQLAEGDGEGLPAETLTDEPPLAEPLVLPPGQAELEREQREAEITRPEVQAHKPGPEPAVREHHEVHVVVTERRGNARWSTRTVQVGEAPIQLLGLSRGRRRAVLQVAASSGDGYFVAIGPKDRVPAGTSTTFTGGHPTALDARLGTVFLIPLMLGAAAPIPFPPDDWKSDTIREIFAVFVPDTGLKSHGHFALVSVSEELGDAALEQAETVPPGTGGER